MESLYTKYRPQTFEQVVGQGHVVETLKRAVLEGRTSHAYLFCGPRGTGKTTMARILAKALMCERGPAALPDGSCEQCRLISAGEHPDVMELDAASRTGVDNVREEIISRVSFAPTLGRCKVYIIDEVHMLTTAAFNALLKTLEEPPSHVVFVMCTTDPQKILPTILSRVQRFDFHAIGNDEMQAHLAYVCSQEGFTYEPAALELVVRHARGGMRDALTTLEQLAVFGGGNVGTAAATDFLGEVSGSVLGSVSRSIASRDVPALFEEVSSLADAGRDLLQFTKELAAHMRDVYVVSVAPSAVDVVSAGGEELEGLRAEAAAFGSPDRVARVLTVLGDASNEMRTATNQRLVLEIAFTRIARPESDLTIESLAERVADLERQVAILSRPGALAPAAPAPAAPTGSFAPALQDAPASQATAPRDSAPAPAVAADKPLPSVPVATPAPAARLASQPDAARAAAPAAQASVPASSPAPAAAASREPARAAATQEPARAAATPRAAMGAVTNGNLQRSWKRVVEALVARAPAKGSLLLSSTAVEDDGQTLTVSLPKGSRFAARMLERADVRESVDPAVEEVFGPRRVVYVESSLASQAISRAERAPRPASPAPAPAPSAPAATPAARPAAAPAAMTGAPASATGAPAAATGSPAAATRDVVPEAAPVPTASATSPAPAPQAAEPPAGYPMPWDEPAATAPAAPAPAPAPADDVVPYGDFDVVVYEEEYESDLSVPTAPAPQPSAPEPPAAGGEASPGAGEAASVTTGLTDEFAGIVSMLSAAFGPPVSVSIESASDGPDDEADGLAYDDEGLDDPGFTDEPVEDDEED